MKIQSTSARSRPSSLSSETIRAANASLSLGVSRGGPGGTSIIAAPGGWLVKSASTERYISSERVREMANKAMRTVLGDNKQ